MVAIYAMLLFYIMIDMAIHSYIITSNQIIVYADFARPIKICFLHPCTTHEIVPPFFKYKSHDTEMVRGTSPMIVANVNYYFQ